MKHLGYEVVISTADFCRYIVFTTLTFVDWEGKYITWTSDGCWMLPIQGKPSYWFTILYVENLSPFKLCVYEFPYLAAHFWIFEGPDEHTKKGKIYRKEINEEKSFKFHDICMP